MPFSTKDADHGNTNDRYGCADQYHGAWWYNACQHSNLNGKYYQEQETVPKHQGIQWRTWKGNYYSLYSVNMKMRPAGFRPGEDFAESDIRLLQAKIYAISSDTHQLQFIKLQHFKQERF